MQKRILPLAFITAVLFSLFNWNCTKLDTTDIGSDQLPAVDNVHTFDTIMNVISSQGLIFDDSIYVNKSDDQALGAVNNDPLFGTTQAHVFMQLKPTFFPYYLGSGNDTLFRLDSVVLCLKYKGYWGDSMKPVHLEVREVVDDKFRDSITKANSTAYQPTYSGTVLGTTDVDVTKMANYIKFTNGRDSVNYQIRIKLNAAWAAQLYGRDSSATNSLNNAFYNDSIFRRFYNGIAVLANNSPNSNALLYVNIADTATKIEIHYVKKIYGGGGKMDSTYSSLRFNAATTSSNASVLVSNGANRIVRNRAGRPVLNPQIGEHFLQASPGNYVNLSVPGLAGLPNCIVHRAEVIVEQVPTDPALDNLLSAPNFLFLDLKDTGTTLKWKPVYFDLNTTQLYDPDYKSGSFYLPSQIDYTYYGGYQRTKTDPFGNQIKYYNFNISRYVQQIVTKHSTSYDMRIYAPYYLNYSQYSVYNSPFRNNIAYGRVRIGSGSNPNYRLRLRIVYSKI